MWRYMKYAKYFQYLYLVPLVLELVQKARADGKITVVEIVAIVDRLLKEAGVNDVVIVDDRPDAQ